MYVIVMEYLSHRIIQWLYSPTSLVPRTKLVSSTTERGTLIANINLEPELHVSVQSPAVKSTLAVNKFIAEAVLVLIRCWLTSELPAIGSKHFLLGVMRCDDIRGNRHRGMWEL